MATTKTSGTRKRSTSSNGSRAKSSTTRKGSTTKRSTSTRASSNGRSKTASARRSRSQTSSQSKSNVETIRDTAVDRAKGAGQTIATAAGKAKTPLIAGGTALLGAAAGAAIKDRLSDRSKGPIKRMRDASMPRSVTKLDLDTVKSAADRISAYGQQASDIAAAVEKTRKKNG
jgi:hypothetical protein